MAHDEYGVFNWFIRKALDGEMIPVFGDGRILRDFLYVEDLVECLLMVAATEGAYGEVFNVGGGVPVSFHELAQTIVKVVGSGQVGFTEFTRERKEVEPGDYYTDISKIKKIVGWKPETGLEEGIRRTGRFLQKAQEGVLGLMVKIFDLQREYEGLKDELAGALNGCAKAASSYWAKKCPLSKRPLPGTRASISPQAWGRERTRSV